jgi:hypothetical protein
MLANRSELPVGRCQSVATPPLRNGNSDFGGSVLGKSLARVGQRVRGWLYQRELAYGILRESYSLIHRIRIVFQRNPYGVFGVPLGPTWKQSSTGHLERCTETQGRMMGMQSLFAKRPWASLVDLQLYLEGWDKGVEWARRSGGSGNPSSCNTGTEKSASATSSAEQPV